MGNRAVITDKSKKMGVYLHWNGGRDTIEPLLAYCKLKGVRNPNEDPQYAYARMCQIMGNFFGGNDSIGVGLYDELDTNNYDNGTYVVDDNWTICERLFFEGQEQQHYDFIDMFRSIDEAQPEHEQLGVTVAEEYLKTKL